MSRDKASLPFGDETMLERIVGVVSRVVDEVWVVAREGQAVAGDFRIARDPAEGLGPLAGLVTGLAAMAAERAFLTTCDVPLLKPAYVARLLELSRGHPIAVPVVGGHTMVTSAVYSRAELREVDAELDSLRDCNTPEAYRDALRAAGCGAEGL
jgi:molybdopterin-guanine dinucleotide biosynthesis protein A